MNRSGQGDENDARRERSREYSSCRENGNRQSIDDKRLTDLGMKICVESRLPPKEASSARSSGIESPRIYLKKNI